MQQKFSINTLRIFYHRGGHGDVEKLSSPTLRDGSDEEKLVAVSGEERRFILQRERETAACVPSGNVPAGLLFLLSSYLLVQAQTHAANTVCFFYYCCTGSSVFIMYLSVQPALTLVFVFLKTTREGECKKRSDVDTQCVPEIQISVCLLVMWSSSASHHNRTNSQTHDLISSRSIYFGGERVTLIQTPVVASHSVRIELFWPLFSQLTASLVLVAHFTMVM